jgi:alpha-ketoglutarate-dependent taurine dioxygenase
MRKSLKYADSSELSVTKSVVNSRSMGEAIRSVDEDWELEDAFTRDLVEHGVSVLTGTDTSTTTDILRVARLLGTTELGIDPAMSGPLVMDIRYDDSKIVAGQRPSYFSRDRFPVHTDMSYVPDPPRFLLTQCVRSEAGAGGAALLADCSAAWTGLSPALRAILSEKLFTFEYPPNCIEGHTEPLAICAITNGAPLWRFRLDGMTYPPFAADAVLHFHRALEAATVEHQFITGDLLVVDNTRVVHGRTAFSASGDYERYLRRVYAREL